MQPVTCLEECKVQTGHCRVEVSAGELSASQTEKMHKIPSLEVMAGATVQAISQSAQRELQRVRAEGDPPCMQQSLGVMVRPEMHQPDSPSDTHCCKYYSIIVLFYYYALILYIIYYQIITRVLLFYESMLTRDWKEK